MIIQVVRHFLFVFGKMFWSHRGILIEIRPIIWSLSSKSLPLENLDRKPIVMQNCYLNAMQQNIDGESLNLAGKARPLEESLSVFLSRP